MLENNKPNYYAILTAEVRYDTRLNPMQKLLYAELTALANQHGFAFPSNKYLADLYGTSEITISRNIKALKDLNYIKVVEERTAKGTIRKIFIAEPLIKNDNSPLIKNDNPPLIKNDKHNNTRDIIIQDINKERYIDSKNNIDSQQTKKEKISLSITKEDVINISNENNLDTDVSEKFYYYYKSRNWKVNNFEINKNNLKTNLLLWHKRENNYITKQNNQNNIKHTKIIRPDWMEEYLEEIKELKPANRM